jgi:hypothetical protein
MRKLEKLSLLSIPTSKYQMRMIYKKEDRERGH